jgi:hypothetical protein
MALHCLHRSRRIGAVIYATYIAFLPWNPWNWSIWGLLEVIQKIQIVGFNQSVHKTFINQAVMMPMRVAVSQKASGGDGDLASITNENSEWIIDDTFD